MTGDERRIAALAAQDLEGWALELPLGSETRRDLLQTARTYRLAAAADSVALRAVSETRPREEQASAARQAAWRPSVARASQRPDLAEASPKLHPPQEPGA